MRAPALASKRARQEAIGQSMSMAAPVKGWNTRDPLANMNALYAITLDNWLPGTGTVSVRPGAIDFETGFSTTKVKTLCPWRGAASQKLFASTDSGFYDISAGGVVGAVVQARTNGYCSYVNFTTTGGSFLVTVNGTDDLVYTNGTTWTSIASFTISAGGTLTTNQIFNINSFKRSLYFLKKNSMSFFFLPIDSITGTVSEFPLGGLFNKGGYLVAMGTWTIDGGFGADDYSVFITSEGQAAVYKGTDPSSSTTWALNGIYDLAPPLGAKCFCRMGGDLLVMTHRGIFSMSRVLKDTMLVATSALTDVIGEAFTSAAANGLTMKGWELIEYPEWNVLVCNIPLVEFTQSVQFVLNTKTGAWCRFTNWDGFSFAFYNSKLYMGMQGKVAQVFYPGNDFNASITAIAKAAFNYYTPRSRLKSWKLIRPNLTIGGKVAVNVALDTDFNVTTDYGTAVFNTAAQSRWDAAYWDQALWSTEPQPHTEWLTISAADSYCSAVCLRVISRDATIIWSATDVLYEAGAMV